MCQIDCVASDKIIHNQISHKYFTGYFFESFYWPFFVLILKYGKQSKPSSYYPIIKKYLLFLAFHKKVVYEH